MRLVTLKTYTHPTEAYTLVSKLESEGVQCFLDGEHTITIDPFLSNAMGGVKLKVSSIDLEKAQGILSRFNQKAKKDEDSEEIPKKFSNGFVKVYTFCPDCDSMNVYKKKVHWFLYILAIFYKPFEKKFLDQRHYCADCKSEWIQ